MIRSLKLRNFRNFWNKDIFFDSWLNCIYGNNGLWKSNIVEAISLLSLGELFWLDLDSLVKIGNDGFYIEVETNLWEKLSLAYDMATKKRKIAIGWKPITKNKFILATFPSVIFHPLTLNIIYLSPSLRRDYIDSILSQSFESYSGLLKKYKEVLKNRNKLLQSIQEGKSKKDEIYFWDERFISLAVKIYEMRDEYSHFISEEISKYRFFLWDKIETITFFYKTKIDTPERGDFMRVYLEKNRERDIILGVTHIGPHVDDFDILIDGKSITHFASRGETKTVVLWLKILEARFIESKKWKKPVIIIDDFLSELDDIHKKYVFQTFMDYQVILTSIMPISIDRDNIIIEL